MRAAGPDYARDGHRVLPLDVGSPEKRKCQHCAIMNLSPRLFSLLRSVATAVALCGASALPVEAAANGPTVTINEPVAVTVTGPVEVEGTVEVLNSALRTPFHKTLSATISANTVNGTLNFSIPTGKRLVIETLSVRASVPAGQAVQASFSGIGQDTFSLFLPLSLQGSFGGNDVYVTTQKVRLIIDRRLITILATDVLRSGGGPANFQATVVGYLEDQPAVLN
jgi:hypothetical protein